MDRLFWLFVCLAIAGGFLALSSLWFLLLCAPLALFLTGLALVFWAGSKAFEGVRLW